MGLKLGKLLRGAVNIGSIIPGPWTPFARGASAALSVYDRLKQRNQGGGGGGGGGLGTQYQEALDAEKMGPQGAGYKGLSGFDPGAAFEKYAAAAQGRFSDILKRGTEDLTGSAVGRGRLETGFFNEDYGDLASRIGREYRQDVNSAALQTSGQELSKYGTMIGAEEGSRGRYLDLLSGGLDREQAAANAKRAAKAGTRNAIIGGIADIAGTVIGAKYGNKMGGGGGGGASTTRFSLDPLPQVKNRTIDRYTG